MKGLNTSLLLILIGLVVGIALGSLYKFSLNSILLAQAATFIFFGLIHFRHRQKKSCLSGMAALLLFASTGFLIYTISNPLLAKQHYLNVNHANSKNNFVFELEEQLPPGNAQARFTAQMLRVNDKIATGKVLLSIPKDSSINSNDFSIGTIIYVKTSLQTEFPLQAPYQFDYGKYLRNKGIFGQIRLEPGLFINLPQKEIASKLSTYQIRSYLKSKLNHYDLSPDSRAITYALLLGERQDLSPQLRQNYVDAGVIHILAVSGLHVGILMLLVQFLLKPLGNARKTRLLRLIIVIVAIWLFAILTGLSPSVLRAATMFTFLQIGLVYGQRRSGYNALIASALILLLINPRLLFEVGFQLSYAAVSFIMWLYPKIEVLWVPKNKILRYYWQLVCVSLAAQLGVLPLSLYYFHQFPGLFLVANLVVLPFLGFILMYGILILSLSALNLLPDFLMKIYDFTLQLLNSFIELISQADPFIFRNIYFPLILIPVLYLLTFSLGRLIQKINYKNLSRFLIVCALLPLTLLALKLKQNEQFYILNTYRSTSLAQVKGSNNLLLYLNDEKTDISKISNGFMENLQIKEIRTKSLESIYNTPDRPLLVVDSLAIYQLKELQPGYILLTQSPKINLDRLMQLFPNATIIADASNYRSYVKRWEETCKKREIPFHNTYEKGFYKID
ncbi:MULTISPECIES: ComEC/Rec2 family competence protein [unclassified Leeuwenhoekiella]|uniref:ComEC/Rec2 family competence protein n=1 Tax=unclassified Leeuwenhoekiella TaxID=2615029 RepID=UPI000C562D39|nr:MULTISPECIES: ComEC/Rec2 family competence protein [unclassified Leeuwenhoekiella]MAW97177.1 hypothetical protein [Leeuwenhoekiella sp.]MBA82737.1 hypothetical protein [Leeuwenhoekiella sp.]